MIRLNPDISSILDAKGQAQADECRGYEDHEYQREQESLQGLAPSCPGVSPTALV